MLRLLSLLAIAAALISGFLCRTWKQVFFAAAAITAAAEFVALGIDPERFFDPLRFVIEAAILAAWGAGGLLISRRKHGY